MWFFLGTLPKAFVMLVITGYAFILLPQDNLSEYVLGTSHHGGLLILKNSFK